MATQGVDYIFLTGGYFDDYSTAAVRLAYGSDGGIEYNATLCEVVAVPTLIRCVASPGTGKGHTARVTIGGGVWSVRSTATLSYTPPSIESVASVGEDFAALPSAGSTLIKLTGLDFGPSDTAVVMTYRNPALSSLAGSVFVSADCNVTVAHTEVECRNLPGVGYNQSYRVIVDGQTANSSTQVSSYAQPQIDSVSIDGALVLDGAGGERVTLTGTDFGPAVASNKVNVTYVASASSALSPLASALYLAKDCVVSTAHIEVQCTTVSGVGTGHLWRVFAGRQASRESADATSYSAPVITQLLSGQDMRPNAYVSTDAMYWGHSTAGYERVAMDGDNLGPPSMFNTVNASYVRHHLPPATRLPPTNHLPPVTECRTPTAECLPPTHRLPIHCRPSTTLRPTTRYQTTQSADSICEGPSGHVVGSGGVTYYGGPVKATVTPGCLAASRFVSPGCNVTYVDSWGTSSLGGVADRSIMICFTAPGVGYDMAWSFTVGGQLSSDDMSSSNVMRYHVPIVSAAAVSASGGGHSIRSIPQAGGVVVTLTGSNLGPATDSNPVHSWYYWFDSNNDYDTGSTNGYASTSSAIYHSWYDLVNCSVTIAHTTVECTIPYGVGSDLTFFVEVGHQRSALPDELDYSDLIYPEAKTYSAQVLGDTAPNAVTGFSHDRLPTVGGVWVTITGKNFGPTTATLRDIYGVNSTVTNPVAMSYGPLRDTGRYQAQNCSVVVDYTAIECISRAGVGMDHHWVGTVGGAPANHSANTTAYVVPNITSVMPRSGPHLGGFVVTIDGNNFGLGDFVGGDAIVNVTGTLCYATLCYATLCYATLC